ncbi:MAG: hypothetical protein ACRCVV_11155 [Shewanella sp.]
MPNTAKSAASQTDLPVTDCLTELNSSKATVTSLKLPRNYAIIRGKE